MNDKERDCKLEYDLIDAEEEYHITHRFPRRFDYLTDWERYVMALEYIREREREMRDLGSGMTYKEFDMYKDSAMELFKVPTGWFK